MKPNHFLARAFAGTAVAFAEAPSLAPRAAAGLARAVRLMWRSLVPSPGGRRRDPGGGEQGAAVTAPLGPPDPVLGAAAALALPRPGQLHTEP
jgi:hypothetical protein